MKSLASETEDSISPGVEVEIENGCENGIGIVVLSEIVLEVVDYRIEIEKDYVNGIGVQVEVEIANWSESEIGIYGVGVQVQFAIGIVVGIASGSENETGIGAELGVGIGFESGIQVVIETVNLSENKIDIEAQLAIDKELLIEKENGNESGIVVSSDGWFEVGFDLDIEFGFVSLNENGIEDERSNFEKIFYSDHHC